MLEISYPGFEGENNLGKKEDETFQANREVFKDEVCDANNPNEIKKVRAAEIGFGKYEAETGRHVKIRKVIECTKCTVIEDLLFEQLNRKCHDELNNEHKPLAHKILTGYE